MQASRIMFLFSLLIMVQVFCLFPEPAFATEPRILTYVQALVGAAQFSEGDLTFTETSANDDTTISRNDLSNMPYLGMTFQLPFHGRNTQVGLDGSALFGWRTKNRSVVAVNNQLVLRLESSLWLADLGMGLFIKHTVLNRWRFYAAAGPTMLFGEYSGDAEEGVQSTGSTTRSSSNQSEFGVGGYLRGGFDYRYRGDSYVGICVRGLKTNLNFDNAPEASSGLSGIQGFITFARHF